MPPLGFMDTRGEYLPRTTRPGPAVSVSPGAALAIERFFARSMPSQTAPAGDQPFQPPSDNAWSQAALRWARITSPDRPTRTDGEAARWMADMATKLAPHAYFAGMAVRELMRMLYGDPGVTGLAHGDVFIPGGQEFFVPGTWEPLYYGCDEQLDPIMGAGASAGPCLVLGDPNVANQPWVGFHHTNDLIYGTSYETQRDLGPWSVDPSLHFFKRGLKYYYLGDSIAAPVPAEVFPRWINDEVAAPHVSPAGLSNPRGVNKLQDLVEDMQFVGMPGMSLPRAMPSPAVVAAAQAVREALGLREEVVPQLQPVRLPQRDVITAGWRYDLPEVSVQTDGKRWIPAEPHTNTPDSTRAQRTAKLKAKTPYALRFLLNAFTETNDFLEGIWKTLPKKDRRAGMTKTGNRRTDSMLRDLYNGFDNIDWDEAIGNVIGNEVEDFLIGSEARLWNKGSMSSGQGLGTQRENWMQNVEGHWSKGIVDSVESAVTGFARDRGFGNTVTSGIRRVRDGL